MKTKTELNEGEFIKNYLLTVVLFSVIISPFLPSLDDFIILSENLNDDKIETPTVLFPKEIEINFPPNPDDTVRNIGSGIPENVKYSTKPNSKGGIDHLVEIFDEMSHLDYRSMHPVIHIDNSASASDIISSIEIL